MWTKKRHCETTLSKNITTTKKNQNNSVNLLSNSLRSSKHFLISNSECIKHEDEKNKSNGYNIVKWKKELKVGSLGMLKGGRGNIAKKIPSELMSVETCTSKTIQLQ